MLKIFTNSQLKIFKKHKLKQFQKSLTYLFTIKGYKLNYKCTNILFKQNITTEKQVKFIKIQLPLFFKKTSFIQI